MHDKETPQEKQEPKWYAHAERLGTISDLIDESSVKELLCAIAEVIEERELALLDDDDDSEMREQIAKEKLIAKKLLAIVTALQ
jgi:hypothetical protein